MGMHAGVSQMKKEYEASLVRLTVNEDADGSNGCDQRSWRVAVRQQIESLA